MKKFSKKLLSLLLALLLTFSATAVGFAAGYDKHGNYDDTTEEKAAYILDQLDQLIWNNLRVYAKASGGLGGINLVSVTVDISDTDTLISTLGQLQGNLDQAAGALPGAIGPVVAKLKDANLYMLRTSGSNSAPSIPGSGGGYTRGTHGDIKVLQQIYRFLIDRTNFDILMEAIELILSDPDMDLGIELPENILTDDDMLLLPAVTELLPTILGLLGDDIIPAEISNILQGLEIDGDMLMTLVEVLLAGMREDLVGTVDGLIYKNEDLPEILRDLDLSEIDETYSINDILITVIEQIVGSDMMHYEEIVIEDDEESEEFGEEVIVIKKRTLQNTTMGIIKELIYSVLCNGFTGETNAYGRVPNELDMTFLIDLLAPLLGWKDPVRGSIEISMPSYIYMTTSGTNASPTASGQAIVQALQFSNKGSGRTGANVPNPYDIEILSITSSIPGITFSTSSGKNLSGWRVKAGLTSTYYFGGTIPQSDLGKITKITATYRYMAEGEEDTIYEYIGYAKLGTSTRKTGTASNSITLALLDTNAYTLRGEEVNIPIQLVNSNTKNDYYVRAKSLQINEEREGVTNWYDCDWLEMGLDLGETGALAIPMGSIPVDSTISGALPAGAQPGDVYSLRARVSTSSSATGSISNGGWVEFTVTVYEDGGLKAYLTELSKESIQKGDYGTEAYDAYINALDTAWGNVYPVPSTPTLDGIPDITEYNAWLGNLQTAYQNLQNALVSVDTSPATDKIAEGEGYLSNTLYTPQSLDNLRNAIAEAKAILAGENIVAYDVVNAAGIVTYAISNLREQADKTALGAALALANELLAGSYTYDSYVDLRIAIKNALPVYDDPNIADFEMDGTNPGVELIADVTAPLLAAIADLNSSGDVFDWSGLSAAYAWGETFPRNMSDYAGDYFVSYGFYTWRVLRAAMEAADEILFGGDPLPLITQEDIDEAEKSILDAIANMVYDAADYSGVEAALARVPNNLSVYTDKTAQAVQKAVDAINYNFSVLDQRKVDRFAYDVNKAVDSLQLLPADYSGLWAAIDKIPKDTTVFTRKSVLALQAAIDSTVLGLSILDQSKVDKYTADIEALTKALVKPSNGSASGQQINTTPGGSGGIGGSIGDFLSILSPREPVADLAEEAIKVTQERTLPALGLDISSIGTTVRDLLESLSPLVLVSGVLEIDFKLTNAEIDALEAKYDLAPDDFQELDALIAGAMIVNVLDSYGEALEIVGIMNDDGSLNLKKTAELVSAFGIDLSEMADVLPTSFDISFLTEDLFYNLMKEPVTTILRLLPAIAPLGSALPDILGSDLVADLIGVDDMTAVTVTELLDLLQLDLADLLAGMGVVIPSSVLDPILASLPTLNFTDIDELLGAVAQIVNEIGGLLPLLGMSEIGTLSFDEFVWDWDALAEMTDEKEVLRFVIEGLLQIVNPVLEAATPLLLELVGDMLGIDGLTESLAASLISGILSNYGAGLPQAGKLQLDVDSTLALLIALPDILELFEEEDRTLPILALGNDPTGNNSGGNTGNDTGNNSGSDSGDDGVNNPDTGDTYVAAMALLVILSAGAVFASKRRKRIVL